MGKLNEKDARELERLSKLRDAPDPEPISRHVNFSVDLGKKDQVEMARSLGLLGDSGGDGGGDDGKGGEGDDGDKGGGGAGGRKPDRAPKRGGYFG